MPQPLRAENEYDNPTSIFLSAMNFMMLMPDHSLAWSGGGEGKREEGGKPQKPTQRAVNGE